MKRNVSTPTETGHDPEKSLAYAEEQLTFIAYASGVSEWSSIDELTIDQLVEAVKNVYKASSGDGNALASSTWLSNRNYHLLTQVRKFWWYRSLIEGAMSNG